LIRIYLVNGWDRPVSGGRFIACAALERIEVGSSNVDSFEIQREPGW